MRASPILQSVVPAYLNRKGEVLKLRPEIRMLLNY